MRIYVSIAAGHSSRNHGPRTETAIHLGRGESWWPHRRSSTAVADHHSLLSGESDGERIPLKVSSIESPDSVFGRFPRQHVDEAKAFVLDDGDVEDGTVALEQDAQSLGVRYFFVQVADKEFDRFASFKKSLE